MVGHLRIGKHADIDMSPAAPQNITPIDGSVDDSPPEVGNIPGDAFTSGNFPAEIGDGKHTSPEGEQHTSGDIDHTQTQL